MAHNDRVLSLRNRRPRNTEFLVARDFCLEGFTNFGIDFIASDQVGDAMKCFEWAQRFYHACRKRIERAVLVGERCLRRMLWQNDRIEKRFFANAIYIRIV